jgi:hypothetical protein
MFRCAVSGMSMTDNGMPAPWNFSTQAWMMSLRAATANIVRARPAPALLSTGMSSTSTVESST